MFCGDFGVAPQTIVGITMSNNGCHQLSSCYLEELDFRAPNCKWTTLAIEGHIQALFFLIMVSQCGGIYGTASVSTCRPVFHTLEFATLQAYFEESPNRGSALFALFLFW